MPLHWSMYKVTLKYHTKLCKYCKTITVKTESIDLQKIHISWHCPPKYDKQVAIKNCLYTGAPLSPPLKRSWDRRVCLIYWILYIITYMLTDVKAPKVFLCSREGLTLGGEGGGGGGGGRGVGGGGEVFPDQITQFTRVWVPHIVHHHRWQCTVDPVAYSVESLHPLGVVSTEGEGRGCHAVTMADHIYTMPITHVLIVCVLIMLWHTLFQFRLVGLQILMG